MHELNVDKHASPTTLEALRAQLIARAFEAAEKLVGNSLPWDTSSTLIVLDPLQYDTLQDDAVPEILRTNFTADNMGAIAIHFDQLFDKDPPAFELVYTNHSHETAAITRPAHSSPDSLFVGVLQKADESPESKFSLTPQEMSIVLASLINIGVIVNSEGVIKPSADELQRINPQDVITSKGIEAILVNRFNASIVKDQSFTVSTENGQHYKVMVESFDDQPVSIEIHEDMGPYDRTDIFAGNVLQILKVLVDDYRNAIAVCRKEGDETREIIPDEGDLRRGLETVESVLKSLEPSKPELPLSDEFPQN